MLFVFCVYFLDTAFLCISFLVSFTYYYAIGEYNMFTPIFVCSIIYFVFCLHITTDGMMGAHVEQDLVLLQEPLRIPQNSVGIRVDYFIFF